LLPSPPYLNKGPDVNTVFLSRLQFGLTISFHYIFPPLSIGLGLMMVIMEALYLKTGRPVYHQMMRFWTGIFALTFGLGVATGIVMEFEFGTNWANYSRFVGDVFGGPLAMEGIFAFFLESGFLAILLFGHDKVGKKLHFFSTVMVFLGSAFSAVWITVANSWMQTPRGFKLIYKHGQPIAAHITNFTHVVFNPSSIDRLSHTLIGAFLSGAFLVLSVSAFYILRKRHVDCAQRCIKIALVVVMCTSLLQLLTGDFNARMIAKYQPAKLAAFEGHFKADAPAGMSIMGWVNTRKQKVYGLRVPGMLSWLLYGNPHHPVIGLDHFKPSDRPPVNPVFQSYHLMVAMGMAMIGLAVLGCLFWWRGTIWRQRWLLWAFVLSAVAPLIANEAGWFSAEVGRQPWIVYGILKTSHGVSPHLAAGEVLASIIMFSFIYLLLGVLFLFLLTRKIIAGPAPVELPPDGDHPAPKDRVVQPNARLSA
jgi:cytochrome d ubiquinol oxidase subunit I